MDAAQLVARLIGTPPDRMSDLEVIIGPVSMSFDSADLENMGSLWRPRPQDGDERDFTPLIRRLYVGYDFDMDHDDASRPRDVGLLECSMYLYGRPDAAEAVLAAAFGAPRYIEGEHGSRAEYGSFYIRSSSEDAFTLEWHRYRPRWAIPVPDAAARTRWLEGLRDRIAVARTVDEIEAYCRPGAQSLGVSVRGTMNTGLNRYAEFTFPHDDTRGFSLGFEPPVGAQHFAEVFGWMPAVGQSPDAHMSMWYIWRRGEAWYPISGALQHWELRAELNGWPGGVRVGEHGPSPLITLGDQNEVLGLTIEPRFR